MSIISKIRVLAIASVVWVGCAEDEAAPVTPSPGTAPALRDHIGRADAPASLLVLAPTATAVERARLASTLAQLGGDLLAALPPRLMIAAVPPGADAVLAGLGVVARFDRAVTPADLTAPSLAEERFVAVHAARWFPSDVPAAARLAPTMRLRPLGEREGTVAPFAAIARLAPDDPAAVDPDDQVSVPYASGTIVVSVILPESNGAIDTSTEDWSEALIRETYLKVTAGLDPHGRGLPLLGRQRGDRDRVRVDHDRGHRRAERGPLVRRW